MSGPIQHGPAPWQPNPYPGPPAPPPGYPPPGYPPQVYPQQGYPQHGPAQPGYPQYGHPMAPVTPPPPKRSRKLWLLIGVPLLVVALVCGGGAALLIRKKNQPSAWEIEQNARETSLQTAATAMGTALMGGDKAAFTALADPAAPKVRSWLTDRFTSLRALGVTKWQMELKAAPPPEDGSWSGAFELSYCFDADCPAPLKVNVATEWSAADPAAPKLTSIRLVFPSRSDPPWATVVLQAKRGARTMVAATAATAGKIKDALPKAEAGARVADRFSTGSRPSRYVIYLADAKQWKSWSGGTNEYTIGVARPTFEWIVIKADEMGGKGKLANTLTHEMTHVASLRDVSSTDFSDRSDVWWLTEGLAEYAASGGSFTTYSRRRDTVEFLRCCRPRDLRVTEPVGISAADGSGRYGFAYLGVNCLMTSYGKERTLAFFRATAVDRRPLESAAGEKLGVSWPAVSSTCARFVDDVT